MASVKQLLLSLEAPEDEPESGDPIEPLLLSKETPFVHL